MSDLTLFMKANKKVKEATTFQPTESICDKEGKPLVWKIQPLTTAQTEKIRVSCTLEVPIPGKPNQYRQQTDTSKYMAKMLAASVTYPDLSDKALQDDYGVMSPEALVMALVDSPGDYNAFIQFVQEYNNLTDTLKDQVDIAKN